MYIDSYSSLRRIQKATLLELIEKHYTTKELTPIYTEILLPSQNRKQDPAQRITKKLLVNEFGAVFKDPSAGKSFFEAMSNPLQKTISTLVWSGAQPLYSLECHLGFDISTVQREALYREDSILFQKGFHWLLFSKESYYSTYQSNDEWKQNTSVSLPAALCQWLKTFLPKPNGYHLEPVETLPESNVGPIQTYRCDETIIDDFRIVADYILRGNLKFTQSETISKPCIRAIEKLTDGDEFFPDGAVLSNKLPLLRHDILAGILSVIGNKRLEAMRNDKPDPAVILRGLIESILAHPEWMHEFVLKHLKENYESKPRIHAQTQLSALFRDCGKEGWITLQNLTRHVQYQDLDIEIFSHCTTRLQQTDPYRHRETIDITPETVFHFYTLPLLQGAPFLLAALGLAEIAYTRPPANETYQCGSDPFITPFDGFIALRLTPLGNYALRNTDKIELKPSTKKQAEIILNPQRLTVVCRNVDPVTELALLEFMEKHSPGCYRLTRQTFMKGCNKSKDVKERTTQFKRNITSNLPPLWENFLNNIEETAVALKPKINYKIYQLPHAPELKELFSTDPLLREKTTKVEGLKIAIHKNDLPAVSRRLKAKGYLIG